MQHTGRARVAGHREQLAKRQLPAQPEWKFVDGDARQPSVGKDEQQRVVPSVPRLGGGVEGAKGAGVGVAVVGAARRGGASDAAEERLAQRRRSELAAVLKALPAHRLALVVRAHSAPAPHERTRQPHPTGA